MRTTGVVMLVVCLAVPLLSACSNSSSSLQEEAKYARAKQAYDQRRDALKERVRLGSLPSNYKIQVDRVLARMLRDPDSRKVEFFPRKANSSYGGLVCGQVNAKNSFGGYTGFTGFVATFDASQKFIDLYTLGPRDPNEIELNEETTTKSLASEC